MARHRWGPAVRVEVPWSDAGGNLYTCLDCGLKRQARPDEAFRTHVHVWTFPDGTVTTGKTPPCQSLAPSL